MARNLSLALGRPAMPSIGVREVIVGVLETIALIAAAGRVGAAVEARQTPSQDDLKTAGLEKVNALSGPYRF